MVKRGASTNGDLGRQSEPALLILTSLASGPKHGYSLAKDIETFAAVTLGPGTLYGAITRLEERGFIAPVPSENRRQPYRITAQGQTALESAVREMRALADAGTERLRLGNSTQRPLRPNILGTTS